MSLTDPVQVFLRQTASDGAGQPREQQSPTAESFHVYNVEGFCADDLSYDRRRFYKVALHTGPGRFTYARRGVLIDRPALVFSNPLVPYAWESLPGHQGGYFCLFTEDYLAVNGLRPSLQESPLFKIGGDPVVFVTDAEYARLSTFFERMIEEDKTPRQFRDEIIASYLHILTAEALRIQPNATYYAHQNAAARLSEMFCELLDRQFPVDPVKHPLTLRTPGDFAACLSVHVNTLNRALRETTGMTTTDYIAARRAVEAKALLTRTDWPVADVADALGFEYPTYFSQFFKRHTGYTPSALRV